MNPPQRAETQDRAEWRFLQLLCDAELEPTLRAEFCARVAPERFEDVTHRIISEEIRAVSSPEHPVSATLLREHLPGRVTARGFPDVEFDSLFASDCSGPEEASRQIQKACEILEN